MVRDLFWVVVCEKKRYVFFLVGDLRSSMRFIVFFFFSFCNWGRILGIKFICLSFWVIVMSSYFFSFVDF